VRPFIKLVVAAAVAVVIAIFVVNGIRSPVAIETRDYRAVFTDASGLSPNADIRVRGIKVGKVTSIDLKEEGQATHAQVSFTLDKKYRVTRETRLAVKYASLTGVRYIDATSVETGAGTSVTEISSDQTVPSFDVTELFNGLQPVLETLSPAEVNKFSNNATTLMLGDGSGLDDMLESIESVAQYATDRQAVIATIVKNMSGIAEGVGGTAPKLIEFIGYLQKPIDSVLTVLGEFKKGDAYGPAFMGEVNRLLYGLGIETDTDIDQVLKQAFPTVANLGRALGVLPTIAGQVANARAMPASGSRCQHGSYQLPAWGTVLLGGTEVVLCRTQ